MTDLACQLLAQAWLHTCFEPRDRTHSWTAGGEAGECIGLWGLFTAGVSSTDGRRHMGRPLTSPASKRCSCGGGCRRALTADLVSLLDGAADGYEATTGTRPRGFCCPLCLRLLDRGCASRAHYPAEQVGGRRWTLLCTACNSFLGTAYESDAHRHWTAAEPEVRVASSTVRGACRLIDRAISARRCEMKAIG